MDDGDKRKRDLRAARLEAELRANLKKRKEQARARSRAGGDAAAGHAGTLEGGAANEGRKRDR